MWLFGFSSSLMDGISPNTPKLSKVKKSKIEAKNPAIHFH
jgi:hypothetical protein